MPAAGMAPDAVNAAAEPALAGALGSHGRDRETMTEEMPVSVLRHIEGTPARDGVELTWSVGLGDHVDGFNVYRESGDTRLVFAGNDATVTERGDEATFHFRDAGATSGGTYWLGARSCSGPEALIGPIHVDATVALASRLTLTATPNPAFAATRFAFSLEHAGNVRLEVFDLQGRRVATPFMGHTAAGSVTVDWSLRNTDGGSVEAGLYFARLEAEGRTLYARVNVVRR
jgi:hypothetical protein